MKLLVVLLCVLIGSVYGCLTPGDDYDFSLRLPEKLVTSEEGVVRIPCAFTAPLRAQSGRQVWFRGSPEFPLKPTKVERNEGLFRPMISTHEECSVILRDIEDSPGEYGFMLEYGEGERHIFPDRVTVASCVAKVSLKTGTKVFVAGEKSFLTCSLSKLCPGGDPKVIWKELGKGSMQILPFDYADRQDKYSGYSEQLVYTPVPEDHQTRITCEATFGRNLSASDTLTLSVHSQPQILNSSSCTLQQDLLICVCASQGVPLPDINWPLAQDKLNFTMVQASDRHITVRSTFKMPGNFTSNSTMTCASRNALGLSIMSLPVNVIEG